MKTVVPPISENATQSSENEDDGSIHVPSVDLPVSSFLATETRIALAQWTRQVNRLRKDCPHDENDVLGSRAYWDSNLSRPLSEKLKSLYDVNIRLKTIAKVSVEIITPAEGVSSTNQERVLINLHGGGFLQGARYGGQIESIPMAAVARIKVVTVNYRMAPEYVFPAATEDTAAVYRQLLRDFQPENIGIYGCSAGGVLAAQTVAWLQKEDLPLPGAVGMLFGAGSYWTEGDSGRLRPIFAGAPLETARQNLYFRDTDPSDPLAFPVRSAKVMASFPPSLLVAATRDHALSSVVHTHCCLVKHGVEADLHVWEGLGHAFFINPDLPESREVFAVATKFFAKHLGDR